MKMLLCGGLSHSVQNLGDCSKKRGSVYLTGTVVAYTMHLSVTRSYIQFWLFARVPGGRGE